MNQNLYMKKLLFPAFLVLSITGYAQTLFTYGNHKVPASEFITAFEKNRLPSDSGGEALSAYLQLYIHYKLKVQEARDLRMDTLPGLRAELQSFRHQIEKNYSYDKETLALLRQQAIGRSTKDIRLTAFFIKTPGKVDSVSAYKAVQKVRDAIAGNPDNLLQEYTVDGILVQPEDLGYVTVFTLPYTLENLVYDLSNGDYSQVARLGDEFVFFRKESERPAAGKIKVAQILLPVPGGSPQAEAEAKQLADSLYHALQNGADFAELAREFSLDRTTYFNGGEMPEFGVGKFAPDFALPVFSLTHDGAVSKPFKTSYGYHIVKRISATPVPKPSDADHEYAVMEQLMQDDRSEIAKDKLVKQAAAKTGFRIAGFSRADLYAVTDTFLTTHKDVVSGDVGNQTILATFNDGTQVPVKEWQNFLRNSGRLDASRLHDSYDLLWPEFQAHVIVQNYLGRLEQFDPEFARQLGAFEDGNMLFELMQRRVWQVSAQDSAGMLRFYEENRDRYRWAESADAVIFYCSDAGIALQCIKELEAGVPWREFAERNSSAVQADSGRYELRQLPAIAPVTTTGATQPIVDEHDGTASFAWVMKVHPAGAQRSFAEARGMVAEDYQQVLEEQWISELRKKYPVRIHQRVWKKLAAKY